MILYTSKDEIYVIFNKVDRSKMVTITSNYYKNSAIKQTHWILSLEDFLPFMSEPSFEEMDKAKINIYSNCVLWLLDSSYAQNFLHNFSNYSVTDVKGILKKLEIQDFFKETDTQRNEVVDEPKGKEVIQKELITLKMLWDSGDLSFAPDPNSYEYLHRSSNNSNLSLSVINQMTVSIPRYNTNLCIAYMSIVLTKSVEMTVLWSS
jgi:hypothetical protein